ncbi:transmembrane protein, putative [Medicago truncatula]|uniref:Transmembrane protein, putative n=1 Tax=Medicago truncatula TaxID=3880 RepID=A0A072VKW0_MEDTR|nr:transmembrane protein, putative [Medicago truncatula]
MTQHAQRTLTRFFFSWFVPKNICYFFITYASSLEVITSNFEEFVMSANHGVFLMVNNFSSGNSSVGGILEVARRKLIENTNRLITNLP